MAIINNIINLNTEVMEKTNIWGDGFINHADEIGHYNVFGRNVRINPLHDGQEYAKIGSFCHFADNVEIGWCTCIGNHVTIGKNVRISDDCKIGNNAVIGDNVILGKNTVVRDGCVLEKDVIVGDNNEFSQGCVIGYSAENSENGSLRIGDGNFFGAHCTVCRGTKTSGNEETVVGNFVFCGSGVLLAPGSRIAADAEIPYHPQEKYSTHLQNGAQIGFAAEIAVGCTIAEAAVIRPHVRIGAGCYVSPLSLAEADIVPFALVKGDKVVFYHPVCLDKNLDFGTTDDDILGLVGEMVLRTSLAGNTYTAQSVIERFKGRGQWYDRAYNVIKSFLIKHDDERTLMKPIVW